MLTIQCLSGKCSTLQLLMCFDRYFPSLPVIPYEDRCLEPQIPPEKTFRGAETPILTRYLEDLGRLGFGWKHVFVGAHLLITKHQPAIYIIQPHNKKIWGLFMTTIFHNICRTNVTYSLTPALGLAFLDVGNRQTSAPPQDFIWAAFI